MLNNFPKSHNRQKAARVLNLNATSMSWDPRAPLALSQPLPCRALLIEARSRVRFSLSELEASWRANLSPSPCQMSPERHSLWLADTPAPGALETCSVHRVPKAEGLLRQIVWDGVGGRALKNRGQG